VSVTGALLGLSYAIVKKPRYIAVCTFVLEDGKSGGGIGTICWACLSGGYKYRRSGGGIFEGDKHYLELYKSRLMIEKTLLTECNFNGKNQY